MQLILILNNVDNRYGLAVSQHLSQRQVISYQGLVCRSRVILINFQTSVLYSLEPVLKADVTGLQVQIANQL